MPQAGQKIHPRPRHQLLVADGLSGPLTLPVLLPMSPGAVVLLVVHQLEQVAWNPYSHKLGRYAFACEQN